MHNKILYNVSFSIAPFFIQGYYGCFHVKCTINHLYLSFSITLFILWKIFLLSILSIYICMVCCRSIRILGMSKLEVPPKGGFSLDLCLRNVMLEKKGHTPKSFLKTGTTIFCLIFKVWLLGCSLLSK